MNWALDENWAKRAMWHCWRLSYGYSSYAASCKEVGIVPVPLEVFVKQLVTWDDEYAYREHL